MTYNEMRIRMATLEDQLLGRGSIEYFNLRYRYTDKEDWFYMFVYGTPVDVELRALELDEDGWIVETGGWVNA